MKPEQHALDEIDALIAQGLDEHGVPIDNYQTNNQRYVKCELCQGQWHGLPNPMGCPGEYATQDQRKMWIGKRCRTTNYIGYVTAEHEGVMCNVHLYLDDHGGYVGLLMPVETRRPGDLYTFDQARASFSVVTFGEGVQMPTYVEPERDSHNVARLFGVL